ncbi:transglutaminase-like domain-containing protein [Gracilibacillus thailandensis]|uniref:Transglutaminase n=1 Tax=Gracilibacillus thailandensis TaxID=563735 RepID=A0A6N7QZY1_9BACI|nr:transglutaminase-like domain-containing protein [Gracilibacillus thailandensis]MRI66391.1 transglutaminase [Gracilibacillus thailandensis]
MKLIPESYNMAEYLKELEVVNYSHSIIQNKKKDLFNEEQTEIEKVKTAFEFVRDEISHSWDIQGSIVTCQASDVLRVKEGICYAKANLLAAILRAEGIPTGFCYQKLMIFDTPEKGYSLHALNGVFLSSVNRWIRVDARGNKPGVQAEFSLKEEKLAFSVQEEFGEEDYPIIFTKPNHNTITTLQAYTNVIEMYKNHLPDTL